MFLMIRFMNVRGVHDINVMDVCSDSIDTTWYSVEFWRNEIVIAAVEGLAKTLCGDAER